MPVFFRLFLFAALAAPALPASAQNSSLGLLPIPAPPSLAARSYIMMDAKTRQVLVEHNADLPLPPASLAKLMTSYILSTYVQSGLFDAGDKVRISENAWSQNPVFAGTSLMFIEPARPVTLSDLHLGLAVSSGNDASVAIAEHISGTERDFTRLMNQVGGKIGMQNTHFADSHGLSASTSALSTARDIAILSRELILNAPDFYRHYAVDSFRYSDITQRNRNRLLGRVPGVDGIKTGHTQAAGYCLAASAERGDMRLITVVMGSPTNNDRFTSTRRLLDYGFRYFRDFVPLRAADTVVEVPVWGGERGRVALTTGKDVHLIIPRGRQEKVRRHVRAPRETVAPVAEGAPFGKIIFTLNGDFLAEAPLYAAAEVARAGLWRRTLSLTWRKVVKWWLEEE